MRGRFFSGRPLGSWLGWFCLAGLVAGSGRDAVAGQRRVPAKAVVGGACRSEVLEGEVRAGESFARPIGGGLEVQLKALSWGSGWLLRVLPAGGKTMQHDYAELATPPYASVSPLLLSTDFSFRAQDAVAWNPRRFRFSAQAGEFARLLASYERYMKKLPPTAEAENELAGLASRAAEGTLQILDARFVPGTANQAGTAALVATHFSTTAHVVEEPAEGRASPLGKLSWIRFQIRLSLPPGFAPADGVTVQAVKCP